MFIGSFLYYKYTKKMRNCKHSQGFFPKIFIENIDASTRRHNQSLSETRPWQAATRTPPRIAKQTQHPHQLRYRL